VYLDRKLNVQNHHDVIIVKAQKIQGRVHSIERKLGLIPENVPNIKVAAVQSVVLYRAEL
jgi:hypothetical protein